MGYISKMVFITLSKNVEARDNMMLVVKSLHDYEMSIYKIPKEDYYDAVFSERLTSIKTIDRIWRKVLCSQKLKSLSSKAGRYGKHCIRTNGGL